MSRVSQDTAITRSFQSDEDHRGKDPVQGCHLDHKYSTHEIISYKKRTHIAENGHQNHTTNLPKSRKDETRQYNHKNEKNHKTLQSQNHMTETTRNTRQQRDSAFPGDRQYQHSQEEIATTAGDHFFWIGP